MKITNTLRANVILATLLIMLSSMFLTGLSLFILWMMRIFPEGRIPSLVLPLASLLASFIIGTVISFIVSKKILEPMRNLIDATKTVAKGDFSVHVEDYNYRGELGDLLRSFNKMAEELGSIELFRSDFINTFSHEFKTPIVSIRGFAKQLASETLQDETRREYSEIIVSESERLANMSSNILLLTKLENQQIITDKVNYSLDEQIRNCILLLERQWEKKSIEWNLNLDKTIYRGNPEMMSHVWINLLSNAIKFSPPNAVISVSCLQNDSGFAVVSVADSGCGMEDDVMQHVFEKFYQGDLSHTTPGNGLGLSLVKRIVELCDGSISVKSTVGEGSEFTVELPGNAI